MKTKNKPTLSIWSVSSTWSILSTLSISTLFTLLFLPLTSCETTEKIDDFPLRPPQLVVNCFFNESVPFGFQVSKSLSVLDNADLKFVENATVKLSRNGELIEVLTQLEEDGFYRSETQFPEPGARYSIEVSAPDFDHILTSEEIAPKKVGIEEASVQIKDSSYYEWVDHNGRTYYGGHVEGSFDISLADPQEVENYYSLGIFFYDTIYYEYEDPPRVEIERRSLYISSEDPSIENDGDSSNDLLFRDLLFDGQKYQLKIEFTDWNARKGRDYYIELVTWQKSGYLYKRSIGDYYQARNDPFSEPVQIFGNIQNGYGIFSGFALDVLKIHF